MSSLIYLSHKNDEVILDRDFEFVLLNNGLNLLSESTYRLMMGQLADICQTEKQVSIALLRRWLNAVEQELTDSFCRFDACDYVVEGVEADSFVGSYFIPTLTSIHHLLNLAEQEQYLFLDSCCV